MQMVRRFRLPRNLSKNRGDLEDIVTYFWVFIPIGFFIILFVSESFKAVHAYEIVSNAAQLAVNSGTNQASYSQEIVSTGNGFEKAINQSTAISVTDQVFNDYIQSMNVGQQVQILNTDISFPTLDTEQFTVKAQYTPTGLFAFLNTIDKLYESNGSVASQSFVWTVRPTSKINGQTIGGS